MLKKINRIAKRKDFEEIKAGGKLGQTPLFGYVTMKKDEGKMFGVVVSKKVSKKAVERNRIRRLIAEGVRKRLTSFPEGVRVIFLVKKLMLGKKQKEVEAEIDNLKNNLVV